MPSLYGIEVLRVIDYEVPQSVELLRIRPSFASVDVEKAERRKLGELGLITLAANKYRLQLRTSNPAGLVYTGKMTANEGGAVTCKPLSEIDDEIRKQTSAQGSAVRE